MTLRVGLHSFFCIISVPCFQPFFMLRPSVRSFYYGPTAQKSQAKKKKGLKKESVTIFDFFFHLPGFWVYQKKKGYSRNRPKCCKIKKNSGWTIGLYIGLQSVLSGSVTVDSQIVDYPVTSLQELWREFVCRPISRGHALPWKKRGG